MKQLVYEAVDVGADEAAVDAHAYGFAGCAEGEGDGASHAAEVGGQGGGRGAEYAREIDEVDALARDVRAVVADGHDSLDGLHDDAARGDAG
jgi:hypothetical protein